MVSMPTPLNIRDLLDKHVTLQLESVTAFTSTAMSRISNTVLVWCAFCASIAANRIASPALLGHITGKFVAEVKAFAQRHNVPLFRFELKESKDQRAP